MINKKPITFIFLAIFLTSFVTDKPEKWKLEKNKNGVKVYSYIPKGESLKEIKMNTVVKTSLSAVVSVLQNVSDYTDWIYNCTTSKTIKKNNKSETIYYSVSDAPWPIDNRDMVLINKIHQDKKSKIVYSITGISSYYIPKNKNMVRIPKMKGIWKFTPLKNGYVNIEYLLKVDIGGKVPNWVTNMFITYGPYQSMRGFIKALNHERHVKATYDFIEEPNE